MSDWTDSYNYQDPGTLAIAIENERRRQERIQRYGPEMPAPALRLDPGTGQYQYANRTRDGRFAAPSAQAISVNPVPPKAPETLLHKGTKVQFHREEGLVYFGRVEKAVGILAKDPTGTRNLKYFALCELPNCCAVVVASGFGHLNSTEREKDWLNELPAFAARFGYTKVMISTTEAMSVPLGTWTKISDCVNHRTGNLVTIFEAPTGLVWKDPDDEDDD